MRLRSSNGNARPMYRSSWSSTAISWSQRRFSPLIREMRFMCCRKMYWKKVSMPVSVTIGKWSALTTKTISLAKALCGHSCLRAEKSLKKQAPKRNRRGYGRPQRLNGIFEMKKNREPLYSEQRERVMNSSENKPAEVKLWEGLSLYSASSQLYLFLS